MTEDTLRRKTVKEERYDIKMIALDLDRTTLDDSKGLTEETRKALEEAGIGPDQLILDVSVNSHLVTSINFDNTLPFFVPDCRCFPASRAPSS